MNKAPLSGLLKSNNTTLHKCYYHKFNIYRNHHKLAVVQAANTTIATISLHSRATHTHRRPRVNSPIHHRAIHTIHTRRLSSITRSELRLCYVVCLCCSMYNTALLRRLFEREQQSISVYSHSQSQSQSQSVLRRTSC